MKAKKNMIYTLWSAAIVLCVLLSVFALFFSACAKQEEKPQETESGGFTLETEDPNAALPTDAPENTDTPQNTDAPQPTDTPAVTDTPQPASSVRLTETADAGTEYQDKIIFLGDSTTYGLKAYGVLSGGKDTTQVWTPASGTLTLSYYSVARIVYPETGEELLITEAVEKAKPEYMCITLGVNGVSFMDEEWFIRDYTALVQSIQAASPDTKIILNSIYPVADSYKYKNEISNEKINAANGWIEQIAADTGCRFLNSREAIVGADGNLPETSQNGDGIHLTGETFQQVLAYLRTHAWLESEK